MAKIIEILNPGVMKTIIFSLLIILPLISVNAQETVKKNRKEIRAERKKKQISEVKNLVESKDFLFIPTQAFPMGSGAINLTHSFSLEITGDSVLSYLPFYGVAYRAEYAGRNSPLDFEQPIQNYFLEKNKKGYSINFEVKNGNDFIKFSFSISEAGNTSLHINSTNRQSISYSGKIEKPEPKVKI